jgi:predicted Zn-dependent peptidase
LRLFFLFFAFLLVPKLEAQERSLHLPQVHEHTLENGLRLFILPRPGSPTVSFVVQFRIGSVNEKAGVTGIAHLLEHLLFKGTTTIGTRDYQSERPLLEEMDAVHDSLLLERDRGDAPPDTTRLRTLTERIRELGQEASAFVVSNEFDAILSENGSRSLNAITSAEATTYFVELPANRAELWFALEADRMMNPVFREFYTERDVVAEERRFRLENNPSGLLYQAHMGETFRIHPYGVPVIGTKEDLSSISRRDVQDYYQRYYGPGNAVVAIAGALDPQQILEWAQEYLGTIPRGQNPPGVEVQEPRQLQERRVRVEFDAEPSLRIGWRSPEATHPDTPALAMLASLLTGGRSSRIYRRLVLEDRIATGVSSGTGPGYLYPGLFSIDVSPRSPHSAEEVEAVIYEELDRLRDDPPEDMELQRVRNQLEASEVRRRRTSFGLAYQVAESASLYGDWRKTFSFTREMGAVTPEDIQRVVQRYFTKDQRTVAILRRPEAEGGEG